MASRFIRVTRNAGGTQVSHTVDLADVTHVRRDPMTGHAVVECSNRVHIDTAEAFTTVRQRVLTADADFHDPTVFADWTGIGASGPVLVNVLQISSIGADLQRGGSDVTFASNQVRLRLPASPLKGWTLTQAVVARLSASTAG